MRIAPAVKCLLVPVLAVWLCLMAGCSAHGGGRVEVTALNYRAIDPPAGPPPRFTRVELDRCYWWTDQAGQVWIAMERDQPVLFGSLGNFRFQLSLVLEKPPAGRARDYLVSKRELRSVARLGPAESRFVSLLGIVALYREPHDRLRGSFRLEVARQAQQLLGGWSRASRYLMMGTFEAVRDEERGRRIAADTEAFGWERTPGAASRPATRPAATTKPAER